MDEHGIEIDRQGPVAWIWLNKPEVRNAFDATLIRQLTAAFRELGDEAGVRVIVLAARGKSFCAGAQVGWMREQGAAGKEENASDARKLAGLFRAIADSPKPTLARVQGAALGGGVGLVACCDIAIGAMNSVFAISEVRLGLIPATIGPYVIRAVGERQARRLFQTAERIDATAAERIGLLHEAVPPEQLDERIHGVLQALIAGAPLAQRAAKEFITAVADKPITEELIEYTAQRIAEIRAFPEAAEGLSAFLEKRSPMWVKATASS